MYNLPITWYTDLCISLGWSKKLLRIGLSQATVNLFLVILEANKSKIKVLAGLVAGDGYSRLAAGLAVSFPVRGRHSLLTGA